MNLQELRDLEVTMDRSHNAAVIEKFVGDLVLNMLLARCEIQETNLQEKATELMKNFDEGEAWLEIKDMHVEIMEDMDLWIVCDANIHISMELVVDDAPDFGTIDIENVKCYMMNTEWDLSLRDDIKKLLTTNLRDCI